MITTNGDFFIVDNSDEHWKALEYVKQWCQLSARVDIATGYFEIGALLALDGEWQKVDKLRILIGSETSRQTVDAIQEAQRILGASLDAERRSDPFLTGLDAIVDALVTGKIEIRIFSKKKFHAKAYITHGRLEVVGSAALVGSSNFTKPGLTRNVELNVRFTGVEVRELQTWFENYWQQAEPVDAELLQILEQHTRPYSPFEVYAKALQTLSNDVEPSAAEWEQQHSKMYPILAPYQREAYHGLKQRAAQWRGAFLTDGVGLGKTFVGLMLAEYFAVKERKNVLILATKTGQDAVWEPELRKRLPDLTGEFTNVLVMAHTDLSTADAMQRVEQLAKRVDIVIIDEGHNFRNRGSVGKNPDEPRSRWWRLQRLCEGKTVFFLTATPINNTLFDFVHQFELFTGMDDGYFEALGIPSVRHYFNNLENTFFQQLEKSDKRSSIELEYFEALMAADKLLSALIVQNSREYAIRSAIAAGADDVLFTKPDLPRAVPYSYNISYTALLTELEQAFEKDNPLFVLPMYFPLAYSLDDDIDTIQENRQKQVVGLIRTIFLKRFESSISAFAGSCADLATKIAQWIYDNSSTTPEYKDRVERWLARNSDLLTEVHKLFRPNVQMTDLEFGSDSDIPEDELLGEVGVDVESLDPEHYDLPKMFDAAFEDLLQLTKFMDRTVDVGKMQDDKYSQLLGLLAGGKHSKDKDPKIFDPAFAQHRVIVFTEFADTARYLHQRLLDDGVEHVDRLDGSRKGNRVEMIRRFAPHYNDVKPAAMAELKPLRVLVSTDVLSEGVNLQDASLIINYDIHWNPVRLMQRIGRVDRRLDAEREAAIIAANPRVKALRGTIQARNFLPPDELNNILSLYNRVQNRVLLISKTLGIPGGRLLNEEDMLDDVKVFNAFMDEYQGEISPMEALRLKYLELLATHPNLGVTLERMPAGAYSARHSTTAGIFQCSIEPIRIAGEDDATPTWTLDGGTVRWALRTTSGEIVSDISRIDAAIAAEPTTATQPLTDRVQIGEQLHQWRRQRHIDLMKTAGLPLDAPEPLVISWMELQ